MAVSEILRKDTEELERATGLDVEVVPEGAQIFIVVKQLHLPSGVFKVDRTDTLFMTDQQYRYSAMDMFWTEVDVTLSDGSVPANADSIESYIGRRWRRFSWHRNGVWNPNRNGLLDHYEFMQARLAMEVRA